MTLEPREPDFILQISPDSVLALCFVIKGLGRQNEPKKDWIKPIYSGFHKSEIWDSYNNNNINKK